MSKLFFCSIRRAAGLETRLSLQTVALCALLSIGPGAFGQSGATSDGPGATQAGRAQQNPETGPVRLRSAPRQPNSNGKDSTDSAHERSDASELDAENAEDASEAVHPYVPTEFERFLRRQSGQDVRRLGSDLVTGVKSSRISEWGSAIPPDYLVSPGDEVLIVAWGSVDADLRLVVDRSGRITAPRVGSVQVGGVRYDQLLPVIERRFAQVFRNFQLSVSLGKLRGIRVFVTGYVAKPGTYSVNPLSTVLSAVMQAGGPSASGSFRKLELKRGSTTLSRLDLYDLLLKGDNAADRLLQAGDVIHVGPVGTQVGVIGSVNQPAVVELIEREGVAHALSFAGGFSALAERDRLALERLRDRGKERVVQISLPKDVGLALESGDVLRAFSAAQAVASTMQQNKRVRVHGEVANPGEFVLPPNSTLQDALKAAGGLTQGAFVYGTQFTRHSVRISQQENYDRVLRDLETDFARSSGSQRISGGDQALQSQVQTAATARLVERLRALKPTGRVVLQLSVASTELPALALEDGDRIYVPNRPTTVGVFGSVFNTGSYIFADNRSIQDYLLLAGGPTKGADEYSMFVVRSNGQVVSGRQSRGRFWFSNTSELGSTSAEPGDTVFVPEEMDKTTFLQAAKDWTQILYQFGIGIAGITSALR
jgi:protein involved in polysaccharide export with SLBB domain